MDKDKIKKVEDRVKSVLKEIPYTISGKKMEIPVKKLFSGLSIDKVAAPGAMRNPESLNAFVEIRNKMSF